MQNRGWGSAPLSLQYQGSDGSSILTDVPTTGLLAANSGGVMRTSSGWLDDVPLPDPHNRTPSRTPRGASQASTPSRTSAELQRQPSWMQQYMARQAAAQEAATQRHRQQPSPQRPSPPVRARSASIDQLQRFAQDWHPQAEEGLHSSSHQSVADGLQRQHSTASSRRLDADMTATLHSQHSGTTSWQPSIRFTSEQGVPGLDGRSSRRSSACIDDLDLEKADSGTVKSSTLPGLLGNALGLRIPNLGGPQYASPSGKINYSQTFKWNQNPFFSFRDVWQSLPRVARVLLVWVLIEAVLIVVYAVTILVTNTSQQFVFPLLITGVFLTYLVWDSVLQENTTQLFAGMLLALVISAARIVANSVGHETLTFKGQALGWFILIMHAITIVLALLTWRDFGWRLHSRLGVDFRRKGAAERRRVYSSQAIFVTLVKFDVMWELCLTAVALALARAHRGNLPQSERLMAITFTGLFTNLIIGWGAWTIVRHKTFRTLWPIVDVLMPISFLQPALTFALVWTNNWRRWNSAFWDSLVVSAPLAIFSRAAVWACMHYILWRIRQLEEAAGGADDDADLLRHNAHLHEELLPLLRGAWLGKPTQASPRKRCFFQLSADGSTLRWSWNKFVRLFYVDEIVCNDTQLTISITMTVDRDLKLLFEDRKTFNTWVVGLERALSMLMGPGGANPDGPGGSLYGGGGSGSIIRTESGVHTPGPSPAVRGTKSRLLQALGVNFTKTGGLGGGHRHRSSAGGDHSPHEGNRRSPRTDSRWTFWSRSEAGTPLSPRTETRVDRLQRVRRMQMAHYLDALRRAVNPSPAEIVPLGAQASGGMERQQQQMQQLDDAASLAPSAARTRRPGFRASPPRSRSNAAATAAAAAGVQPLSRQDLETPSMVWARIQQQPRLTQQQAQQPQQPPATPQAPLLSTASGVWAKIMAGKAAEDQVEGQENVPPGGSILPGGPLAATPVPEARPLAPDEAPISRSLTDMWTLLQSGKPVVQDQAAVEEVDQQQQLLQQHPMLPALETMPEDSGLPDFSMPTPGASPTVDAMLHSIWVDIIDVDDLKFGRRLGAGAQGEVYAAWLRSKPVAVKKFSRAADAVHEVQMHLCAGQHPNVVELRALCQHDQALYLIMEFFPRGTMEVMLHHTAAKRWDTAKLLLIIRSIANGVHYLHTRSPPILHRDLKPGNLFVGVNQTIKIGDFGLSRFVGVDSVANPTGGRRTLNRNLTTDIIGTAHYASPEMLNDELLEGLPEDRSGRRHLAIDVYAFGVTLWEMLQRQRPHHDLHPFQIQGLVVLNPEDLVLPAVKIPDDLPPAERHVFRSLADLVVQCTAFEPDARPSFADILQVLDDIWSDLESGATGGANLNRPSLTDSLRFGSGRRSGSRPSSPQPAASAVGSGSRPSSPVTDGHRKLEAAQQQRRQEVAAQTPPPARGGMAQLLRAHSRTRSMSNAVQPPSPLDFVVELSGLSTQSLTVSRA